MWGCHLKSIGLEVVLNPNSLDKYMVVSHPKPRAKNKVHFLQCLLYEIARQCSIKHSKLTVLVRFEDKETNSNSSVTAEVCCQSNTSQDVSYPS